MDVEAIFVTQIAARKLFIHPCNVIVAECMRLHVGEAPIGLSEAWGVRDHALVRGDALGAQAGGLAGVA